MSLNGKRRPPVRTYIYDPALFSNLITINNTKKNLSSDKEDLENRRTCKHSVNDVINTMITSGQMSRENIVDDPALADMFFVPAPLSQYCNTKSAFLRAYSRMMEILENQTNNVYNMFNYKGEKRNHVSYITIVITTIKIKLKYFCNFFLFFFSCHLVPFSLFSFSYPLLILRSI